MKYYAIPSNNSSVTEKHVVEDDILFTNPLAGKGLSLNGLQTNVTRIPSKTGFKEPWKQAKNPIVVVSTSYQVFVEK